MTQDSDRSRGTEQVVSTHMKTFPLQVLVDHEEQAGLLLRESEGESQMVQPHRKGELIVLQATLNTASIISTLIIVTTAILQHIPVKTLPGQVVRAQVRNMLTGHHLIEAVAETVHRNLTQVPSEEDKVTGAKLDRERTPIEERLDDERDLAQQDEQHPKHHRAPLVVPFVIKSFQSLS